MKKLKSLGSLCASIAAITLPLVGHATVVHEAFKGQDDLGRVTVVNLTGNVGPGGVIINNELSGRVFVSDQLYATVTDGITPFEKTVGGADDSLPIDFNGLNTIWTYVPAASPASDLINFFSFPDGPNIDVVVTGPDFSNQIFTVTGVPETASWSMMLLGIGGIGGIARRRRSAVAATA